MANNILKNEGQSGNSDLQSKLNLSDLQSKNQTLFEELDEAATVAVNGGSQVNANFTVTFGTSTEGSSLSDGSIF